MREADVSDRKKKKKTVVAPSVGMMPLNFDPCFLTLFSPRPVEYESHGEVGGVVVVCFYN